MRFNFFFYILIVFIFASSCATSNISTKHEVKEKELYANTGFALIYNDQLFESGIINKKLVSSEMVVLHSSLKKNTMLKLYNPINSKTVNVKVLKKAKYPPIHNIILTQKVAKLIDLDPDHPFIEVIEIKKNKMFIAKKGNIFDEEKKVATNAPVESIKIKDISEKKGIKKVKNSNLTILS